MLKFYSSDMFSIPKMLREMDPARIETFRSIYGRHLAVATRHIEELRELEKDLFSRHWSSEFEEAVIPQLPWPEDKLELYAKPASGMDSPFSLIATLATIVAIRNGAFDLLPRHGAGLLCSGRKDIQLESALQFANWRVAGNTYLESLRYVAMDVFRATEEKSMLVVLSQAYLGEDGVKCPPEALDSDDPEVSFFAALLLGKEPLLLRALSSPNPLESMVAANKLIRLHRAAAVVDYYRRATPEQQRALLSSIALTKQPVPEIHPALFETILRDPKTRLAQAAADVFRLGCTHPEALRLAELKQWPILHALSLAKLEPETFRAIGELLVRENMVDMSQFAWICLAVPGRLPEDFVERVFPSATSPQMQIELLKCAEKQLDDLPGRPRGTSMERVLTRACFGDHPPPVIGAAWAAMHRINMHREVGAPSPFPLTIENVVQFWPYPEFEARLARLQANQEALAQTFVGDDLHCFLGSRTEPGQ